MSMEYGFGNHCTSCLPQTPEVDKKDNEHRQVDPPVVAFAGKKVMEADGRQVEKPQGYLPGDDGTFAYIVRTHEADDAVLISGAD